ncbi:MAG: ParB N-terminal domain-containing protein [Myxococcales bacterium]|nr:ParB N-terminal domain-containing protein [Myxococcales bacterium]
MNQIRYIPIDDIVVTNPYLRLDTAIEELKKSIRAVGLIHPLIVNGEGLLLAGGRRYSALRALGIEQVPVVVVEHDHLIQELISIDENLMRLPLNSVQMEEALNRGREIYEELYPSAKKVDLSPEALERKPPRPKREAEPVEEVQEPEEVEDGKSSYVEVTAQKTGLSEGAIRSAIIRQTRASEQVKAARLHGELGTGQANELVKLEPEEQDKLLPLIKDRPTKAIRKMVSEAQTLGVDAVVEKVAAEEPMPKEYELLIATLEKLAKVSKQIVRKKLNCPVDEHERLHGLLDGAVGVLDKVRAEL